MRQCPACKRVYNDETLNFCLDDGVELLYGPASDEPPTAILSDSASAESPYPASEAKTRVPNTDEPERDPAPTVSASKRSSVIAGVVGLLLVTALGFGSYWFYGRTSATKISSIAVMPFVNESGNADVEYLSDGMTETLINSLTQLPDLNVKPRSSAFRYKGRESETKLIGSELGVGALLTGRVVQRGDDITLFLTLVDTASENQIWGKQYSRKLANLVSLQTEIVRDVSESLRQRPNGADADRSRKDYSADPEAYRLYLQGRYHWNKRSRRGMELAIEHFKESAARDPQFARAFAGLADSLILIGGYTGAPAQESIADARAAAETALSLDPESGEAHVALGTIFFYYDHDLQAAQREFRRAIELDPKSGYAHQMLGLVFTSLGEFDQGLGEYRVALELEPVSLPINRGYGLALTYARKLDESVAQFNKTIQLDPAFGLSYYGLATAFALQEKYAASVEAYAKGLDVSGNTPTAARCRAAFASGGWSAYLRLLLEIPASGPTPRPHFVRAIHLTQLGDKDGAIAELNKSFENREAFVTLLKVHPSLDPLRDDPRFKELVAKVGFRQ